MAIVIEPATNVMSARQTINIRLCRANLIRLFMVGFDSSREVAACPLAPALWGEG